MKKKLCLFSLIFVTFILGISAVLQMIKCTIHMAHHTNYSGEVALGLPIGFILLFGSIALFSIEMIRFKEKTIHLVTYILLLVMFALCVFVFILTFATSIPGLAKRINEYGLDRDKLNLLRSYIIYFIYIFGVVIYYALSILYLLKCEEKLFFKKKKELVERKMPTD